MGAVRKIAYSLGRILAKIRASYLQGFYSIHVKIRRLHDKSYAKGGWYKGYSDKKYTSAIHKTVLFAFVFSFAFFTIFQSLITGYITRPKTVQAGANSKTWTTNTDFEQSTNLSGLKTVGSGDESTLTLQSDPNQEFGSGSDGALVVDGDSSGSSTVNGVNIVDSANVMGYGANYSGPFNAAKPLVLDLYLVKSNNRYNFTDVTLRDNAVVTHSVMSGPKGGVEGIEIFATGTTEIPSGSAIDVSGKSSKTTGTGGAGAGGSYGGMGGSAKGSPAPVYGSESQVSEMGSMGATGTVGSLGGLGGGRIKLSSNGLNMLGQINANGFGGLMYSGFGDAGGGGSGGGIILSARNFDVPNKVSAAGGGGGSMGTGSSNGLPGSEGRGGNGGQRTSDFFYTTGQGGGPGLGGSGGSISSVNGGGSAGGAGSSYYTYTSAGGGGGGAGRIAIYYNNSAQGDHGRLSNVESSVLSNPANWSEVNSPSYSGGSSKITTAQSASLTYSLENTTSFSWVATKGTGYGRASVVFDGEAPVIIDLHIPQTLFYDEDDCYDGCPVNDTQYLQEVFLKNSLDPSVTHTVTITALDVAKQVNLDYFKIMTDQAGVGYIPSVQNNFGPYAYFQNISPYLKSGMVGGVNSNGLKIDVGDGKTAKAATLNWNGSTAAAGQKLLFKVRAGNNQTELDENQCYGPGALDSGCADWTTAGKYFSQTYNEADPPNPLKTLNGIFSSMPAKRYLEVLVRLESDGENIPTLNDVTLSYDTLESPNVNNISLAKTDGSNILKTNGSAIGSNDPGGYTNETALRVVATGLTCGGSDSGQSPCSISSTNIRPEVEVKPIGTAFTGTGTVSAEAGNNYVMASGLLADTSYHVQVRAIDDQGRASAWVSYGGNAESEADFTIEQGVPTGSVTIGGASVQGAYTRSRDVSLTITAQDNGTVKSSPTPTDLKMRLSNDGSNWSSWEAYAGTKSWQLGAGADGVRNVYIQLVDNAGNTSGKKWTTQADWEAAYRKNIDSTSISGSIKLGPGDEVVPDYGTGADGELVVDGTTAGASTIAGATISDAGYTGPFNSSHPLNIDTVISRTNRVYNFTNILIRNGAVLTHTQGIGAGTAYPGIQLKATGTTTIDATSSINVDSKGYNGGIGGVNSGTSGSGPGGGPGGWTECWEGGRQFGGAGSYGGKGQVSVGAFSWGGQPSGATYDTFPELGSGGGGGADRYYGDSCIAAGVRGGFGGGSVSIFSTSLSLSGAIRSNGESSFMSGYSFAGGPGSGGSVYVVTGTSGLDSSRIFAEGGSGGGFSYFGSNYAGKGGGGIIKVQSPAAPINSPVIDNGIYEFVADYKSWGRVGDLGTGLRYGNPAGTEKSKWSNLRWSAENLSATNKIGFQVRTGDAWGTGDTGYVNPETGDSSWYYVTNGQTGSIPISPSFAASKTIEVRMLVYGDGFTTPTIHDVGVESGFVSSNITLDTTKPGNVPNLMAYYASNKVGGALVSGNWYADNTPYFEWGISSGSDVAGYRYCSTTGCTPNTPASPSVTATRWYAPTITQEGRFYMRVSAVDNAGNLSEAPTEFIYSYDVTAPGRVTGLRASTTLEDRVNLVWNIFSDAGSPAESYIMQRVEYNQGSKPCAITNVADWNGSDCNGFAEVTINSGQTNSYADLAINLGTKYAYRIKAKDQAHAEYGLWNLTLAYGFTVDTKAPEPLTASVTATVCDGTSGTCPVPDNQRGFSTKVTWLPFEDTGSGVSKYKIYRSESMSIVSSDWQAIGVVAADNPGGLIWFDNDTTNAQIFSDDGKPTATGQLNDFTTYYYRITGVDFATDQDEQPDPNETDLFLSDLMINLSVPAPQTPDVTSSLPPDYVTATAVGLDETGQGMEDPVNRQQINITWSEAADVKARSTRNVATWQGSGIASYKIYRYNGSSYVDITSDPNLTCIWENRTCSNLALTDRTQYQYKISTFDVAGNPESTLSSVSEATTFSGEYPSVPQGINIQSKKGISPASDPEIGKRINIKFNGSKSKNYKISKYEVYRSEVNYGTNAEWLNSATKLEMVPSTCQVGGALCFETSAGGGDIVVSPISGDDRDVVYEAHDLGLTDAKKYFYRVRSQDDTPAPEGFPDQGTYYSGLSAITPGTNYDGWDITPDSTSPAQPQNLKVKDIYGDGVNYLRNIVTWERIVAPDRNGSNDFSEYRLYRSNDGIAWTQVLESGNNPLKKGTQELSMAQNYYIDLVPLASSNQYYYYYITSVDNAASEFKYDNNSIINASSNESVAPKDGSGRYIAVSLNPAIAQPTIVKTGVNAPKITSLGVSSATIEWFADQPTDSVVEYRAVGSTKWVTAGDREAKNIGDSHIVTVVGLSPKTTYEYRIISRNYLGNEDVLGDLEPEKQYLPTLTTKEFIVSAVQKNSTTSTAEITWETNLDASSAFVEYQLQKQGSDEPQSGTAGVDIEKLEASPKNHKVILKGLRSARPYSFKVKSISKDGFVAESPLDYFRTQSFDSAQFVIAPASSNVAEKNITATSAQIVWSTAIPTTSWVDYGTTSGQYDYSSGDDNLNTYHAVKIENLASGSTYYYRVRVKDLNEVEYVSQEYSFRAIAKPKISDLRIKSITPYEVVLAWETNVPTDTLVNWGNTSAYGERRGKSERTTNHELKIDSLIDDAEYHYQIVSRDEFGNEVVDEDKVVRTPLDTEGPKIVSVKTDIMPLAEGDETAQVIISYETNKPATTLIQYDEGVVGGKYSMTTIKDTSLNVTHTVIVKDLTPATTYHFRILTEDRRKNQTISNDYTFLTPSKEKSILQLILKALEETFSWVKNVGSFFRGVGQKAKS